MLLISELFPMRKGTDIMQSVLIDSGNEADSDVIPVKTSNLKPRPIQKSATSKAKPKSKPRSANSSVSVGNPLPTPGLDNDVFPLASLMGPAPSRKNEVRASIPHVERC